MSETPRRAKPVDKPPSPMGYRTSRRGSKSLKSAKRAERQRRVITEVHRTGHNAKNVTIVVFQGLAVVGIAVLVLLLAALVINTTVRWNAQRLASNASAESDVEARARENVLIIGADGDEVAGFLALRVDAEKEQVYGIAIPDGAFLDVPGQGFVRIGEAYPAGPEVVMDSVSNFLTAPFRSYLIVPSEVYQDAVKNQDASSIVEAQTDTNMSTVELDALGEQLARIPEKNVVLVPMPVKPIKLGDQTYFEPQRAEIADLLKSWWGVDPANAPSPTRVIVYNGAGAPGIAGQAAQQLIRSGVRVVDTQNADRFDYKTTKVVVKRGDAEIGNRIRSVLGAGTVSVEPSPADVADVIVIIGRDFKPVSDDKEKGE